MVFCVRWWAEQASGYMPMSNHSVLPFTSASADETTGTKHGGSDSFVPGGVSGCAPAGRYVGQQLLAGRLCEAFPHERHQQPR